MYTHAEKQSLNAHKRINRLGRNTLLKDGNTSSFESCQECRTKKITRTQIYTSLLWNIDVDTEAQKNFPDKLPNILTAMTWHDFFPLKKVHPTSFVCHMITVQDHTWCFPLPFSTIHATAAVPRMVTITFIRAPVAPPHSLVSLYRGQQTSQTDFIQWKRAVKRWELWLHLWRQDDWAFVLSLGSL